MLEANPVARISTSMGVMWAELYVEQMPITVSNFMDLANDNKFYNFQHVHQACPGFLIQLGCPYTEEDPTDARVGTGGPPANTEFVERRQDGGFGGNHRRNDEGKIQDEFNNVRLSNLPGTLSMANTGKPNSGGSQFFINLADNSHLDWFSPEESKHPVFGKLLNQASMNVALAISKVPTTSNGRPVTPIFVESVTACWDRYRYWERELGVPEQSTLPSVTVAQSAHKRHEGWDLADYWRTDGGSALVKDVKIWRGPRGRQAAYPVAHIWAHTPANELKDKFAAHFA
eukprot:TRINITY_DN4810_c0_g2_i1.p1 TRINITY_DN4810_c0_g2~~TRINITY_DN4810_c0_g2_i1.p1  ORF type:complete len:316 (+),score=23.09 TRINITY_DN4810_c0_g2_i1:89-949(+)